MEIEPTTSRFYSHTLCRSATTGLNNLYENHNLYEYKNKIRFSRVPVPTGAKAIKYSFDSYGSKTKQGAEVRHAQCLENWAESVEQCLKLLMDYFM